MAAGVARQPAPGRGPRKPPARPDDLDPGMADYASRAAKGKADRAAKRRAGAAEKPGTAGPAPAQPAPQPVDDEDQADEVEDQAADEKPGRSFSFTGGGIGQQAGGAVLALFLWPMVWNLVQGGPGQMWGWIKAKWINEPYAGGPGIATGAPVRQSQPPTAPGDVRTTGTG